MCDKTVLERVREELEHDHHRLHALVDEIRNGIDRESVASALTVLHEQLAAHFNVEERPGGLYDALGLCAPQFRRPLARLVDDHYRLTATVRDLRERAREPWRPSGEMLTKDVVRLAAALADHEGREREMLDAALAPVEEAPVGREAPARGEAQKNTSVISTKSGSNTPPL